MSALGKLLFARYALPPNLKKYCGGERTQELLYYVTHQSVDRGINRLLEEFSVPPVYMQAIAADNAIKNTFDPRVVEAYWLGNRLLYRVKPQTIYKTVRERFGQQLNFKQNRWLKKKLPSGLAATHSFHVFEVHRQVGLLPRTVETMDRCRISWGKIVRINEAAPPSARVSYRPLVLEKGQLILGQVKEKGIKIPQSDSTLSLKPTVGDVVSMHWNYLCDILSPQQVNYLHRFTRHHIHLANQTL